MLGYRLINRYVQNKVINPTYYKFITQTYASSSSSSSDSDNEKRKKVKKVKDDRKDKIKEDRKEKSGEALKKLNFLLKQMIEDDTQVSNKPELNLAKPKPRVRNNKTEVETTSANSEQVEKQIISAAKNVAESLGGNTKQTESELLSKLLSPSPANDEDTKGKSLNLSDVISGMKIDRTVKENVHNNEVSRAHQVRQLLERTNKRREDSTERPFYNRDRVIRKAKYSPQTQVEKINLFGAEPLGIFATETEQKQDDVKLKTWNILQERELRLAITHPPDNYFQEMILWTQQGKIWKFPVDNEQGMEEEQNVYFAEHIFLDKHLADWCPTKGPIRHFMELVCVGLSKNPYLSVEAKKDHIMWYKDYFMSKQQLLKEIGAMPTETKPNEIAEK